MLVIALASAAVLTWLDITGRQGQTARADPASALPWSSSLPATRPSRLLLLAARPRGTYLYVVGLVAGVLWAPTSLTRAGLPAATAVQAA